MDYKQAYEKWCNDPYFDEATREELKSLAGDEKEIEDRFYRTLEFGTAGLRGVIGAGTNRMNVYTVRQATQGLANYILSQNGQNKGVAIAHDSLQQMELRLMYSRVFVRFRSCLSQFVSLDVSQVLLLLQVIIQENTMDIKYIGRMAHR